MLAHKVIPFVRGRFVLFRFICSVLSWSFSFVQIHLFRTGVQFSDENTPCPNELRRSKQKYASMSDDKRPNAKRRENYHRKKA